MGRKRSATVMLVLALVVTLIVGCTQGSKGGGASSSSGDEPVVIRFLKPGTPGDSPEIPRVEQRIEEEFFKDTGIKIDLQMVFYDWDVFEQKFTLDLTAGTAPDFGRFWTSIFFQFYSKGYFQPVGDVMEKHAPNLFKQMKKEEIEWGFFKGEMAGVPLGGYPVNQVLVIRQDKLDALGKKMPTTVAELEDVMAAYKAAHPDEYPLHGPWWPVVKVMNFYSGIPNFAGSGRNFIMKEDGTVTTYFMHEKIPAYNELANRWYKNGWISPDFLTIGDEMEAEFIQDKGLIMVGYHASALENVEQTASTVNPNARGAVMPNLSASWGDRTTTFDGYNNEGYIGIPKSTSAEKAEIIAKLINWELDNMENFLMGKRGELGVDYQFVDGKVQKMPEWEKEGANGYSWEHWMVNRAVFSEELNFQMADEVEGYESVIEFIQSAKPMDDPLLKTPYLPVGDLAAKVDALNVKLGELQSQILVGQRPLSDWSQAKKIWEDGGGLELEKQITAIYNELK